MMSRKQFEPGKSAKGKYFVLMMKDMRHGDRKQ